jgi:hypothetical protein
VRPGRRAGTLALTLLSLALASAPTAAAGREVIGEADPEAHVTVFPEEGLYDPYIADPWQHGFAINIMSVSDIDIQDSSTPRINLKMGGSFGFLRFHPPGEYERGWQLNIEAGFNVQTDIDNGYDVIGWDGIVGLLMTKKLPHGLSLRLGHLHRSSHLGDELIQRTGRTRIEYTREEILAGLSWKFLEHWRIYGDSGYAFTTRSREQEIWRAQAGAEYMDPHAIRGGRAGFYAALNAHSWQEKDWQVDLSAAAGFAFIRGSRRWRTGLMVHHGTVPIGEFYADDETFVTGGIWLDL